MRRESAAEIRDNFVSIQLPQAVLPGIRPFNERGISLPLHEVEELQAPSQLIVRKPAPDQPARLEIPAIGAGLVFVVPETA